MYDNRPEFRARYGFYLQGKIVPPSVEAAYLFFCPYFFSIIAHRVLTKSYVASDASASAVFTIDGKASVSYDSSMIQLASFGFPGMSILVSIYSP